MGGCYLRSMKSKNGLKNLKIKETSFHQLNAVANALKGDENAPLL
jgi:hypothetical protein